MSEATGTRGTTRNPTSTKSRTIALWVLRVLVGVAFLGAGSAKLTGAPPMVAMFATIGIGQWFRIVTGLLEVTGAIGLFVPRLTLYAAALLALVMLGAITSHLAILGGSPVPSLALLLLSSAIIWLTWDTRGTQAVRDARAARASA